MGTTETGTIEPQLSAQKQAPEPVSSISRRRRSAASLLRMGGSTASKLVSPLIVLGLWAAFTYSGQISPLLLPTPGDVVQAGVQVFQSGYQGISLWENVSISMQRILIGWGLAVISGAAIGLLMGLSSKFRALVDPLIEFYRPIPPLGYLSLLIVWFGIGETSKDVVLYLAALPPTVLNAADAVKAVRRERVLGVLTLGASRVDVLRYVTFPSSLPSIITGARVSFSNAFSTLVAAETLAASSGLGWLSIEGSRYLDTAVVIFVIILMGAIGMVCDRLIRIAQAVLCPWQGHA